MEIVKDKTKINEFVLENNKAKVVHNIPARIIELCIGNFDI